MKRAPWAAGVFAVASIGLWVGVTHGSAPAEAYASLRQARSETVPGTFGFVLSPPPQEFSPSVSPSQALRAAVPAGQTPPGAVMWTLANVPSLYADGPAWVFFFRDLCFVSNKGDIVAPSRSAGSPPACSVDNLYVEVVDASSGKVVSSETGYDTSSTWAPAIGAA
jgi:hypothetical protein